MQEYKVDHNGSIRDNNINPKTGLGNLYAFEKDKPVTLPDDAAKALGDHAVPTGRTIVKDVKNALNKMVGNDESKTK